MGVVVVVVVMVDDIYIYVCTHKYRYIYICTHVERRIGIDR